MAVSAQDHDVTAKSFAGDVMKLEAAWITLWTATANRTVGPEPL
jgi:hypothetical protein